MKHTHFSSLVFDVFGTEPHAIGIERVVRNIHLVRVQGLQVAIRMDHPGSRRPLARDAVAFALAHFELQPADLQIDLWQRFQQHLPQARVLARGYWDRLGELVGLGVPL